MNPARTRDGAELAWWSQGRGEPVLLIAGQSVTHHAWDPVLDTLARHHRVLTFDHRGIGRSTLGEPEELTTRSLADDAAVVLDAAGVERAHVFGHSLGGRVAQWLALDHSSRVGALVLGATTSGDRHGPARAPAATAALLSGDPDRLEPLFFSPESGASTAHPRAAFTAVGDRNTLRLYFQASRTHDTLAWLPQVTAPTLVQHGTDDVITHPEHARRLAAVVPGAQLQLLDGLRHGYYLQSPAALASITTFLVNAGKPI